jgi:hypothetical protein
MAPLSEIRPATSDEAQLWEQRRTRSNNRPEARQQEGNAEIVEKIRQQMADGNDVITLVFEKDWWGVETLRKGNMLREAFHSKGVHVEISVLKGDNSGNYLLMIGTTTKTQKG